MPTHLLEKMERGKLWKKKIIGINDPWEETSKWNSQWVSNCWRDFAAKERTHMRSELKYYLIHKYHSKQWAKQKEKERMLLFFVSLSQLWSNNHDIDQIEIKTNLQTNVLLWFFLRPINCHPLHSNNTSSHSMSFHEWCIDHFDLIASRLPCRQTTN